MFKNKNFLIFFKKWPNKNQWRQFFKVLTKKEKIAFAVFFLLFFFSFLFLLFNFYFKNTKIAPAKGGTHIEGVAGQPRFINPIYANSDVDRDLTELLFSGLMKYDENLNIVPDLAEKYEVNQDGKEYKFYLKKNLFWSDKTPLTTDDIVFTIKAIQNPDLKSPLRANWVGVEVEKVDDLVLRFKIAKPYSAFLENCTLKILPRHIWEKITPENFAFADYNLKPIGSGPYKLKEVKSQPIKSLTIIRNSLYSGEKPNISEIKFLFFDDENSLIKAVNQGKVKGFSLSSPENIDQSWNAYSLALPRYFAVFFNQGNSKVLADKNVRLALNYGTNKKAISEKIVDSPILPEFYGFEAASEIYEYDIEKAKKILEEDSFKDNNNDGLREKTIKKELAFIFKSELKQGSQGKEVEELQRCLGIEITGYFGEKTKQAVINFQEKYAKDILEPGGLKEGTGLVAKATRQKLNEVCFGNPEETLPLKFSLTTVDQPQMVKIAELLKSQWEALGANVEIKKYSLSQLEQDIIKPRNYESLLFGEVLGAIPDPLPFWHSSQEKDPGLNLALYKNEKADGLLEENRKSADSQVRAEKLAAFQNILIKDIPAVFLYSPDYIYLTSKEIKGIAVKKITDPSKRFIGIENWYIKTKRVWK